MPAELLKHSPDGIRAIRAMRVTSHQSPVTDLIDKLFGFGDGLTESLQLTHGRILKSAGSICLSPKSQIEKPF